MPTASSSSSYAAIVIGGGHNGLVTAFYLARAGLRVQVMEAQPMLGGACKTEELIPGYRFSTCANYFWCFRPKVLEDMRLLDRGLTVGGAELDAKIIDGTRPSVWWHDSDKLEEEIGRIAPRDASRWKEWQALWHNARDLLGPLLLSYPPSLGRLSEYATRVGQQHLLATLMTSSLAELTDRHFDTDIMRAGVNDAPCDVGSLYDHGSSLLAGLAVAAREYSETGQRAPIGWVRGGMGAVILAMEDALAELNVSVRTQAPVERILVEGGRASGVRLVGGEEVGASLVITSADPKRTFESLVEPRELAPEFLARIRSLRCDVAPLKLHCAVSGLPEYPAFAGSDLPYRGQLTFVPSRRTHERTWVEASRGELPDEPFMVAMMPSAWDPTLAPQGHHTVSFWILYAPKRPARGTWPERRDEMAEKLLAHIARYSPNFRDILHDYFLLTPHDLEERVLLTDGNIHHVDMTPSQLLWQRPCPELARYRSPIPGLYSCGAGQHPCGEVNGGPGHNAAHAVLEDLGHIPSGSWQQIAL
jgi:phytoene dehydrogenase-like protein